MLIFRQFTNAWDRLKNKSITGIVYVHDLSASSQRVVADLTKLEELGKKIVDERKEAKRPTAKEGDAAESVPNDPIDSAALANVLVLCTSSDPRRAQAQYEQFKNNDWLRQKEEEGYVFARASVEDRHDYTLQRVIERSMDKLVL
jgi:hypothetical protein